MKFLCNCCPTFKKIKMPNALSNCCTKEEDKNIEKIIEEIIKSNEVSNELCKLLIEEINILKTNIK